MDAAKGYTVFLMRPDSVKNNSPRLPRLFAAPFSLLPNPVHSRLIALALNKALEEQIREGDLDILQHRSLAIKVRDAGITFALTFDGNRLMARGHGGVSDLSIAGTVYDFLLLVGREEDPDTLVFQRRLVMQGDTELGLEVKNFLDGLDVESLGLYRKMEPLLKRALPVYRRVFGV